MLLLLFAIHSHAKEDKTAQKNKKVVEREERQFEKDISRNPDSARPYLDHANNLAVINSESSRAAGFYDLALKHDSLNATIYKDYGKYLFEKVRSYNLAKTMLEKSLALAPADAEVKKHLDATNQILALQDADNRLRDFGTTTIKELNLADNYAAITKFDSLKIVVNEKDNQFNYQTLLARYLADDKMLTPQEMYMLIIGYSTHESYNPFNYNDILEMKMVANQDIESAIGKGNELIKTNPLNPTLNKELMYYYRKKNDTVQADRYANRIRQFFSGVLFSGNGSCNKPYISLWAKEEYNFITFLGKRSTENHSMGTCAGQMAEIIEVIDPATQKTEPIYFNVALIYMQSVGK